MKKMEQQEVIAQGLQNGVEKSAVMPQVVQPKQTSVQVQSLLDKRMEMLNALNGAKADRDAVAERLGELEKGVNRQEGAVLMLNQLIQESDPELFQKIAAGG